MAVEMTERARLLLNDLMNAGIIRDMVFAHVTDKKQLKELVTLSKEYMPSVVKSLWLEATEEKFAKLSGVCAPERLELYRSSIEVLTADARKDLRDFVELRAKFPKLRIVNGSCKKNRDLYYRGGGSSATIEFGHDESKPRLDLELEKGERLDDPKFGLWPPEKGVFDLRQLTTLGDHETWEYGYGRDVSSEEDDVKIYPFRCEGSDEEVFLRTVFVHVEMVYLRACATKLSHLRAIVDVAHGLNRLDVVVSKGPTVNWKEEKRQSKEMAQQFEETVVKLGHLEHLEHLDLFAENEEFLCLHLMRTLPWKALRTLECNVEPSIILREQYGRKLRPLQLLRPPQSPPPGNLEKVVVHLNGELYQPPNPMFFAYALLEALPVNAKISFELAEPSSFEERGYKVWDYQHGFDAINFKKWVEEALKAMIEEMTAGSDAMKTDE